MIATRGGETTRTVNIIGMKTAVAELPDSIEYGGGSVTIDVTYEKGVIDAESRELQIIARVDEAHPLDRHTGEIRLAFEGPQELSTTIPITLEVVEPITAEPAQVFVGFAESDGSADVVLALVKRHKGSLIVPIESVVTDSPITWRESDRLTGGVELNFVANDWPAGITRATLSVRAMDGESVEVPVVVVRPGGDHARVILGDGP